MVRVHILQLIVNGQFIQLVFNSGVEVGELIILLFFHQLN